MKVVYCGHREGANVMGAEEQLIGWLRAVQ